MTVEVCEATSEAYKPTLLLLGNNYMHWSNHWHIFITEYIVVSMQELPVQDGRVVLVKRVVLVM